MKRGILWVVALAIVLALTGSVQAEEKNNDLDKPWEKGAITFGSFVAGTNSNVRVGVPGIGVNIDVEEALGLETTTTVFRTDGFWRFTDSLRHRLEFTWFALRRSGNATLARDITIDGVTIPLGSKVDSILDLDIYKLGYSYSFFQDDRMDLAVGAGLFITPISFEFSATGAVNNYTSESVTAPLPVLGMRADFAITPKWMLKNGIDLFYLELGDFKGSLVDFKSNLEYNWFENFGVGVGVESFNLNVEAEGSDYPEVDFVGAFGFKYIGAMIYAKLYF